MINLPSLLAIVALAVTATSASALTDADIAPAALFGKTLTFSIEFGNGPFAPSPGTWAGTISSAGTGFKVENVSGSTAGISTTCTSTSGGGYTTFTLAKFIEGQKPAQVTLYLDGGVGKYEVSIQDLFSANQHGTFTIGAPVVLGPEINLQLAGKDLVDGKSKADLGTVKTGKSKSVKFTIENTGDKKLDKLSVSLDGKNKGDFKVSTLAVKGLAKDKKTTFQVTFKPKSKGTKKAEIHVKSNDKVTGTFDVKISGEGK